MIKNLVSAATFIFNLSCVFKDSMMITNQDRGSKSFVFKQLGNHSLRLHR